MSGVASSRKWGQAPEVRLATSYSADSKTVSHLLKQASRWFFMREQPQASSSAEDAAQLQQQAKKLSASCTKKWLQMLLPP